MPKNVENLTSKPLETMYDGTVYQLPPNGSEIFQDEVADKFVSDHNRLQYPAEANSQIKQIVQVKAVPVEARYVAVGATQVPQTFRHTDGSEFKTLAELIEYTKERALADAGVMLAAGNQAETSRRPLRPKAGAV